MLLSIIIPAYNVAPYIERCLRSLHDQDLPKSEYEIIVVNDGSPDNVKEIVEGMQLEITNLILINQENKGVSAARNEAIKIAGGMYLMAIDPDDYVLNNSLMSILNKTLIHNVDVSFLVYEKINDDNEVLFKADFGDLENHIFNDLCNFLITKGEKNIYSDPDRSVAILYKNSVVKKMIMPYPVGVPFLEDAIFLAKIFCLSDTFLFINDRFYQRTIRPGSATNSNLIYTDKAKKGFELGVSHIFNFKMNFEEKIQNNVNGYYLNQILVKFQFLHLKSELQNGNRLDYRNKLKEYSLQLKSISLHGIREPYWLLGFIIKYAPVMFPIVLIWLKLNAYRLILLSKIKST